MKTSRPGLAARYLALLRAHLARDGSAAANAARTIGRRAVARGVAAVELAQIHEAALRKLARSRDFAAGRGTAIRRAAGFLTEALRPVEAERVEILQANRRLVRRMETLRRHATAMARARRRLEREIRRRQAGEVRIVRAKTQYHALHLESQVMQGKLRNLARQIMSAQEEERRKISRELHDEVVQTLVGINVELTALGRSAAADVNTLKQRIARTRRLVENSVKAVHRFARELRPAVLDDIGLIPALHAFSKALADRRGLRIQITAVRSVEELSLAKRTVLFRVAQEALNNVVRHADASRVTLVVSEANGTLRLEIHDDGKSFQVGRTLVAKNFRRLGLVGMRERIEMIGGRFAVKSSPGAGTTVRADIPFARETP